MSSAYSVRALRGNFRHRVEEVRPRGWFAGRDFGMVRIMAVHADLAFNGAGGPFPVASGPAVSPGFPVAIGRPVATAAERRAFRQFDLAPVAGLQQFQILLVVTVKAVVVPVMRPVPHHDVLMFLRNDDILLRIKPQNRRFAFFMAGVAIKV